MTGSESVPAQVRALSDAFREGLEAALGPRLASLYLYGSVAFPPSPVADVDFHALVASPFDAADRSAIEELHERLRGLPLGDELDGYYVTLDDARLSEPPAGQKGRHAVDHSWALHRAHIHAGRFVLVHGWDPREIVPVPTWAELDGALQGELAYIAERIAQPDVNAYSVLNLCRILYSYEARDVVTSKLQAATWAIAFLPTERHELIRAALRGYGYGGSRTTADAQTLNETPEFLEEMSGRIEAARRLIR